MALSRALLVRCRTQTTATPKRPASCASGPSTERTSTSACPSTPRRYALIGSMITSPQPPPHNTGSISATSSTRDGKCSRPAASRTAVTGLPLSRHRTKPMSEPRPEVWPWRLPSQVDLIACRNRWMRFFRLPALVQPGQDSLTSRFNCPHALASTDWDHPTVH